MPRPMLRLASPSSSQSPYYAWLLSKYKWIVTSDYRASSPMTLVDLGKDLFFFHPGNSWLISVTPQSMTPVWPSCHCCHRLGWTYGIGSLWSILQLTHWAKVIHQCWFMAEAPLAVSPDTVPACISLTHRAAHSVNSSLQFHFWLDLDCSLCGLWTLPNDGLRNEPPLTCQS